MAQAALKKGLQGLEHKDEVFQDSKTLNDVVEKIEVLDLPADSKLAKFAALWKGRATKATGWDLLTGSF